MLLVCSLFSAKEFELTTGNLRGFATSARKQAGYEDTINNILISQSCVLSLRTIGQEKSMLMIDKDTRVLVQGFTGKTVRSL